MLYSLDPVDLQIDAHVQASEESGRISIHPRLKANGMRKTWQNIMGNVMVPSGFT